MGIATTTLTMTSRLAESSKAPVLPFSSQRLPGSEGYLVKILPPLQNFPSGDDIADSTLINETIEHQVRNAPEQYLWLHRRFKTRPPGENDIYS
jgi:KDO2-lipid IV(A) lauroyltransferase